MIAEKIYICGKGCISNLGNNLSETRKGLFGNVPAPHLPSERTQSTLKLPLFELDSFDGKEPNRTLALLECALEDALPFPAEILKKYRTGTAIGTTVANQLNDLDYYAALKEGKDVSDAPLKRYLSTDPSEYLRRKYGWTGPVSTISNACASSADAAALAALWLKTGQCDIAVAGGADELNKVPIAGFNALGVASDQPCKPFDANRKGLNLGEGAGIVILIGEKLKQQLFPGKRLPFLAGFGASGDAHHITSPHPDGAGLERAIRKAFSMAGITEKDIAFINAHGTGTPANDLCEASVFARMFGGKVPYFSTKGKTGHTLGAAGILELIFTVISLEEQRIPASAGFSEKDPAMQFAPNREERGITGEYALSTSLAFGGCNTALIAGLERGS